MNIDFIKMHGAGNDYVYLDLIKNKYNLDFGKLSKKISDRHIGVGSDGLVLILKKNDHFQMRMFNADGSEAEMCGNAIRCVAKYLYDYGYTDSELIKIDTLAGLKEVRIESKNQDGKVETVKVNMGEPILNGRDIPVNYDGEPVTDLVVLGYRGTAVSMGNPHIVIIVDEITDKHVLVDGPQIEKHPLFPERTNVEFIKILDRSNIQMRVWERGSGETLACGTGACASAVACILNGLTDSIINVHLKGGILKIEWNGPGTPVYMTGPAELVFTGTYFYND